MKQGELGRLARLFDKFKKRQLQTDYPMYEGLNPILDHLIVKVINICEQEGMKVGKFCTFRSVEEQNSKYMRGRDSDGHIIDKNKVITYVNGGNSWHQYGLAVDLVFYKDNYRWTWSMSPFEWNRLGAIGESVGLTWGGRFSKMYDGPHFQLTGNLKIGEAKDFYMKGGLLNVWDNI